MGGVLVDDDDAVSGLGDDVGCVQLRPRGTKWVGTAVDGRGHVWTARRRVVPRLRPGCHAGRRLEAHGVGKAGLGPAAIPAGMKERRSHRLDGGDADCRRRAVTGLGERMAQCPDDQAAYQRPIAETHLGLGRMHVDIDVGGIDVEEQRHHRMAVARQQVLVGAAHRAEQQAVAHRPAVDEQVLPLRAGAVEGG